MVVRQTDCKSWSFTFCFLLFSLFFFCYSLFSSFLSDHSRNKYVKGNFLSILLLYLFLSLFPSLPIFFYLSLADLISQCNIINSLLSLSPFSLFSLLAGRVLEDESRDCVEWLLNSRASPRPVSRLRRRTLHFFRHACRSRSSSFLPARRLIFPKSAALPLRHLLSLPSASHRSPFPLPLDRPTQLLVSSFSSSSCVSLLSNFAFPFSRCFCCDDKISVSQRETRRSHLGFFRCCRQTPYESAICISKLQMA